MAVNIIARQFKVPLRDHHFVDISIDRQVRRVMTRLGLVPAGASDLLLIYAAREAYAEFPGIFPLLCGGLEARFAVSRLPAGASVHWLTSVPMRHHEMMVARTNCQTAECHHRPEH